MIISNFLTAIIGGEIANLIAQSGIVAKVVLLILLLFSLISWAVILSKWSSYGRARAQAADSFAASEKPSGRKTAQQARDQFRPARWWPCSRADTRGSRAQAGTRRTEFRTA